MSTVLVVEDSNVLQMYYRQIFAKLAGYQASFTKNGRARPIVPFSTPVMPVARITDSKPCQPMSATSGLRATRPKT